MIVLSRSLVLSPPAPAFGLNNPIIGWRTAITAGNITADHEIDGYPASNLGNPSTALPWRSDDDGEQYLTAVFSDVEAFDYLAVAGHNFGSQAVAFSVEGHAEPEAEFPTWVELVEEIMPADDTPLILRFPLQSLAAIRIKLAAGNAAPRAAVIYAGRLLIMPRRIYVGHTPLPMGRNTRVVTGISESGNYLGRIVTSSDRSSEAPFLHLPPDWYREHFEPFAKAAIERPFFWAWRPQSYPTECGYAWLTGDPVPSNQLSNGMMQVSLKMQGVAS